MTSPWGPAFEAEVNYRQQRIRTEFHRHLWRRPAKRSGTARQPARPPLAG